MKLIEVAPNVWRLDKPSGPVARSSLPCPMVISDEMAPTEQVDGRFYTSKRAFRATGRALGLTEVGNEKPPPKWRSTDTKAVKAARRQALKTATEKYKAGHRLR
jgi:hypothetical protein